MNKNEFQKYLELQNKDAFLEIFDVFGKAYKIESVFSEHDDYFELYYNKESEDNPITINEILEEIKDYNGEIRVDMIVGDEDGNDTSIEVSFENLKVVNAILDEIDFYKTVSNEDFDNELEDCLNEMSSCELSKMLMSTKHYEATYEEFNNRVLSNLYRMYLLNEGEDDITDKGTVPESITQEIVNKFNDSKNMSNEININNVGD